MQLIHQIQLIHRIQRGVPGYLGLAIALVLATSGSAEAQNRASGSVRVNTYVDDDHTLVVTPRVGARADVGAGVAVEASATFDIISAASVDVVSSATSKGRFEETRTAWDGAVSWSNEGYSVSAQVMGSKENDYGSFTGALGGGVELFSRNTTLGVGYSFTDSDVGRAGDRGFEQDLDSHTVSLNITQVLSPTWLLQAGWFFGRLDGYQSSPYRTVDLLDGTRAVERVPSERTRNALVARVRWSPAPKWFVGADYRIYFDTWGVTAHTGVLRLSQEVRPWFRWRIEQRIYGQSAADFYQEAYDRQRQFMTADRELGAMWSSMTSAKVIFVTAHLADLVTLEFDLKVEVGYQRFAAFSAHPERLMLVNEVGVRTLF